MLAIKLVAFLLYKQNASSQESMYEKEETVNKQAVSLCKTC
jgi:hypothetical protein